MSPIKVCFLGTPPFAAVHLNSLLSNSKYEVVGVVTQPDRPVGRKMQMTPSAVKVLANKSSIPCLTPENIRREPEVFKLIQSWQADVAVVVAFGQILAQEFLDSFKFGAVNIHGSLLPRWRGAAPIQRAIEAGNTNSGVTLQRMVKKLDAGPIIGERKITLSDEVTATEVYDTFAVLGCELLAVELFKYIKAEIIPTEQDEAKVTIATKIEKTESFLNWKWHAVDFHNRVRAFTMGPGTYIVFQGKRLKIHKTRVIDQISKGLAGQIVEVGTAGLLIQMQQGIISILEVQPESKSKVSIADFLKSTELKKGDFFV